MGTVNLPSSSPSDTPHEDALIGPVDDATEPTDTPMATDEDAKEYFESVTEDEATNFLMMLHDIHAISFDRLNELKELLKTASSFLPEQEF